MEFCTAINCMSGQIQLPVLHFLRDRFQATYVDMITEPGPDLILAKQTSLTLVQSILARVDISIHSHGSAGVAIVGHHECSGNPADKAEQLPHLRSAVQFLKMHYPNVEIIALWVDEHGRVTEVEME
jgi:hypothetical protein